MEGAISFLAFSIASSAAVFSTLLISKMVALGRNARIPSSNLRLSASVSASFDYCYHSKPEVIEPYTFDISLNNDGASNSLIFTFDISFTSFGVNCAGNNNVISITFTDTNIECSAPGPFDDNKATVSCTYNGSELGEFKKYGTITFSNNGQNPEETYKTESDLELNICISKFDCPSISLNSNEDFYIFTEKERSSKILLAGSFGTSCNANYVPFISIKNIDDLNEVEHFEKLKVEDFGNPSKPYSIQPELRAGFHYQVQLGFYDEITSSRIGCASETEFTFFTKNANVLTPLIVSPAFGSIISTSFEISYIFDSSIESQAAKHLFFYCYGDNTSLGEFAFNNNHISVNDEINQKCPNGYGLILKICISDVCFEFANNYFINSFNC